MTSRTSANDIVRVVKYHMINPNIPKGIHDHGFSYHKALVKLGLSWNPNNRTPPNGM